MSLDPGEGGHDTCIHSDVKMLTKKIESIPMNCNRDIIIICFISNIFHKIFFFKVENPTETFILE